MKGFNQLTLNHETACEAIKNYLNAEVFQEDVEVVSVNREQYGTSFTVEFKPKGWNPEPEVMVGPGEVK